MSPTCRLLAALLLTSLLVQDSESFPKLKIRFRQGPSQTDLLANQCETRLGKGVCTNMWSCWYNRGQNIGLCRDRFLIGSCCRYANATDTVTGTTAVSLDAVPNASTEKFVAALNSSGSQQMLAYSGTAGAESENGISAPLAVGDGNINVEKQTVGPPALNGGKQEFGIAVQTGSVLRTNVTNLVQAEEVETAHQAQSDALVQNSAAVHNEKEGAAEILVEHEALVHTSATLLDGVHEDLRNSVVAALESNAIDSVPVHAVVTEAPVAISSAAKTSLKSTTAPLAPEQPKNASVPKLLNAAGPQVSNGAALEAFIADVTLLPDATTDTPGLALLGTMSINEIPGLAGSPEALETLFPDIELEQTTPFDEVTTLSAIDKCQDDPVCIWQQISGQGSSSSNSSDATVSPQMTVLSIPTIDLSVPPKEQILSGEDRRVILMLNMKKTTDVCGRPTVSQGRVVNGVKATFAQYPWHVAIFARRPFQKGDPRLKCGAVLLNHYWVITAAHCLEGLRAQEIYVRLGEFDLESETEAFAHEDRQVSKVIAHPSFKSATFENDIALLRLMQPTIYQPNIIPICLPNGDRTYAGKTGTVTGWGRLSDGGPLPSVLQSVELPIMSNRECENMYKHAGSPQDIPEAYFICAGFKAGKKDACEGDSGGPMILSEEDKYVLVGIVSWGIDCAVPNQPGAYTRVSKYTSWIEKTVEKETPAPQKRTKGRIVV